MAVEQSRLDESPSRRARGLFFLVQLVFRLVAFGSAIASTFIMAKNKQTLVLFGLQLDAKYSYTSAFKFLVLANSITAAYSLISLPLVFVLTSKRQRFLMFLLDMMIMGLSIAATSAATAIGFVGKYGNVHTGWAAICNPFVRFCHRATFSIGLSYLALVMFFFITIYSAANARSSSVSPS